MPDQPAGDVAVMLGFGELEFLFAGHERWPLMREQLNGNVPDSVMVAEAGAASLLARQLATIGSEGKIQVTPEVRLLADCLVDSPCPIGVAMVKGDAVAPAVYCPTADGRRGLVSIEMPGVALFQRLSPDAGAVDQAMGLVNQAAEVNDAMVTVKAIGRAGCLFRRRGGQWQLGDVSRDPNDVEAFFQPSTKEAVMAAARAYLTENLASVSGGAV